MKITTELLLKRATEKKDKFEVKVYHSKVLDGDIEIRKIPIAKMYSFIDAASSGSTMEQFDATCMLVYECIPLLHDDALIEAYQCVEPYEIVTKVFDENVGEISAISSLILSMYGLDNLVDDLKN